MAAKRKTRKQSDAAKAARISKRIHRQIDEYLASSPAENRYEAAYQPWGSRSWLFEGVQDARFDIDPYTRTELMRQSRYWEKNEPIAKRLITVRGQYTYGPTGLKMVPSSADHDYNEAAALWWANWCKQPDIRSKHPLSTLQGVFNRRWMVDGEIFVAKVQDPETYRPKIQIIESHRVNNPGTDLADNGNQIVDGVEIDDTGKPTAYYVAQRDYGSVIGAYAGSYQSSGLLGRTAPDATTLRNVTYRRVPEQYMLHLYEPERADQLRGISEFYPVVRTIHDLYDLKKLEMLAAKDAAETSTFITNATGQANTSGLRRANLAIQAANAAGQAVTKQAPTYFEATMGGRERYLKTGEDVKQFISNRPTVTQQWYWDYLVRTICAGVGISALLVFPWSLQGTVTRADLDIMAQFFRTKSAVASAMMVELYTWVMGWAVQYDRALDGAPADWNKVGCRAPRAVNVDVGRNSQAIIAEYKMGFRSLADICAEMGHDWRAVIRQKATEAKFIAEAAKDEGVAPESIQILTEKLLAAPPPAEKADNLAAASAELVVS